MIWWFSSTRHELSINPWVRRWIGGTIFDRWVQITIVGSIWLAFWVFLMVLAVLASRNSDSAFIFLWIGFLPWWFWMLDTVIDHFHVQGDLKRYLATDDVILATRAEYVGGHPQLPHGRFGYLLLEGTREDPNLTIGFPAAPGQTPEHFSMPVLDLTKTKPEKGDSQSIAADMATQINEAVGKFLRAERAVLSVDYQGDASRKHKVELTNFFNGNEEIRNWRNYLICAQAEADTGVTPFGPWKSLRPGFPTVEEVPSDFAREGPERPPQRSAFARR